MSSRNRGDLAYLLAHPLAKKMYQRRAELVEEAQQLAQKSPVRRTVERRISHLEEYILPQPPARDLERTRTITSHGEVIGVRQSLRRRFKDKKRGAPAKRRVQALAALEDKLANPTLTWRVLADRYGFEAARRRSGGTIVTAPGEVDLKRAVRHLKDLLRREGIPLTSPSAYPRTT